jgi:molybdopterin/thiamine biosynthesis adenylyltransferase
MEHQHVIKFKQGEFDCLRMRLLEDLTSESFAILFGKKVEISNYIFVNILETKFLNISNYSSKSISHVTIKKDFIYTILAEITNRYDVDTIIDVHTHPFSKDTVSFSGVDDRDEKVFYRFLQDKFDKMYYASIVLSQNQYSARMWENAKKEILSSPATIKTQTVQEKIISSDFLSKNKSKQKSKTEDQGMIFNRGILALGLETMRQIMDDQVISIVGLGGTGSIIAEHLIHMGFHNINLIDHDTLEISNMNRIVGAYYEDAVAEKYKVDVVKSHLEKINPHSQITAYRNDVYDSNIEEVLALSDWIFLATDNHSSRFRTQQISFKYFVPFISLGVNITVNNNTIEDFSSEIITIRIGDRLCLNCLNRINPTKIAYEKHPEESIRNMLVEKGYVNGKHIKEPAVKTLNCITSTIAVDILINQYTGRQKHEPILVYEANKYQALYPDRQSIKMRNLDCFTCNI